MNGWNSGVLDGTIHTDTWTNDERYLHYRVVIRDNDNAGNRHGYAVYAWQWNRVVV